VSTASDPFASVAGLPGVGPSVTAARDAVDALLGHRALRRRRAEVTAESVLRGARASAALEGADVALDALRSGSAFQDPATGELARAAVRVSAQVGPLVDVWARAPLQALARLHVVAAADVLSDPDQLGRPHSAAAAARVDQLSQLLLRSTAAPAVVVAAIVHGELLAVRPFSWGNGLVARAAQRLVLIQRGIDPKAVSIPEVGHVELGRQAYDAALAGYISGVPEGVAAWVRHCAEAVSLGAREGVAVCEALLRG
jgi:hypothetical protein